MDWVTENAGVLLNGVATGLLLFLMSVGLTVIFGLLDVLNLAHGAFFLTGAYIGYRVGGAATSSWGSFLAALLLAVVLGALIGIALMVATAPLVARGHLDQALLTLGLALVMSELLLLVFGKDDYSVAAPGALSGSVQVLGNAYPVYRLAVIALGTAVAAAIWYVIERTTAGARVRATVADREMVEAVGTDIRKVVFVAFTAASALAVGAGTLAGPVLGATQGLGDRILLLALVVIVVGGLGSVLGTLVASLMVGLVQNVGVLLAPEFAAFLMFASMVLVLAFRPQGLIPNAAVVSR